MQSIRWPALDRRHFLKASVQGGGAAALGALLSGCEQADSGVEFDTADEFAAVPAKALPAGTPVRHLVKRSSFGIHVQTLAQAEQLGFKAFLEQQLNPDRLDASRVEAEVAQRFPLSAARPSALLPGYPGNREQLKWDLVGATLFRAMFSPRQLYEVMVEFWGNHFSTDLGLEYATLLKPLDDATVIRPQALGRFRAMLQASAKSPAMLFYLDNNFSTRDAPNENYARELLELHTLGINGGYTETDVKEVARCFTGWTIDYATLEFRFWPDWHDDGAKTVLGRSIPAGGGISDGETVLDWLASEPATARLIATKLCRRFVSDTPTAALVTRVAAAYGVDGDIRAMLRALFTSAPFAASADQKITRPLEFLGQLVRTLNPALNFPTDASWTGYVNVLLGMGQLPFFWATPSGYPDTAAHWSSTSALLLRWRTAYALGYYPDLFNINAPAGDAQTLTQAVDNAAAALLQRPLAPEDRSLLIDWISAVMAVTATTVLPASRIQFANPVIVALLVSSPSFQLR